MIKAMRIQNTVVCFIEGKMYQKTFGNESEILAVFEAAMNTDEQNSMEIIALKELLTDAATIRKEQQFKEEQEKLLGEVEAQKQLINWIEDIRENGHEHFTVSGLKLYMKGINITIPEFLANEFANRKGEDLESLMNFWKLLSLNPDPRCREDLYNFLVHNKLSVTPSGYFVAYRNADIKNAGNVQLNNFVAQAWLKIKGIKKGPKSYQVVFNFELDELEIMRNERWEKEKDTIFDNYSCDDCDCDCDENYCDVEETNKYELQGNLQELYENYVSNENSDQTVYTDSYSGSTTIIIGQPVSVSRSSCDANPDETCSKGLHAANSSWLNKNYFGSVGLAVLIDPRNVVAVPYTDGGKLRCCEYLPIGVIEYDENGNVVPVDTFTFEYEYSTTTQKQLEELLKTATFEELKSHDIIPKELSLTSFFNVIENTEEKLKEMADIISDREEYYGE